MKLRELIWRSLVVVGVMFFLAADAGAVPRIEVRDEDDAAERPGESRSRNNVRRGSRTRDPARAELTNGRLEVIGER